MESTIEFAAAVHAVLRCGAVIVPVSPLTKSEKLGYILNDTRASALLCQSTLSGSWRQALAAAPSLVACVVAGERTRNHDEDRRVRPWPRFVEDPSLVPPACIDQDLAAIIYTSGTTGVPKGVMLTHLNMRSAWQSVQSYLALKESDVIGLALPTTFSYGLYFLLMGLGLGATVVLERSFVFPVRFVERLEVERVTVFPGVPMLFSAILGLPSIDCHDLSGLRLITNAAAALPDAHLARLREVWPHALFYSMYGLTECKRVSYLPPEELSRRPSSVGRGMPNQEHWLVDDAGHRLPNGSTGELVVRGSHVMRGYWEKPAETAERLKPGPVEGERVLYTGDIFRTDEEGFLYFVSRKDDIIKTRGEKVSPREVENAIYQLDGVQDAAVVGVPDATLGSAVKAYVTLRAGAQLTERDIIRHCLTKLESFMAPKFVEFVAELPRTDSGKIRRASLR
jgi:acyl-CoA synthetase (AMP-forming)/AMP-acid ligase II